LTPASLPIPESASESTAPRRSSRTTKGTFQSTKYIDEVYNSQISSNVRTYQEVELAYHADLHTDLDTGDLNHFDTHAYVAKLKKHDPDNPTYMEAMSGDDAQHYVEAMQQEILALLHQRTWTRVDRKAVPSGQKILKGTWAFKLK